VKTERIRWTDIVTLIFFYTILAMVACLLMYTVGELAASLYIEENIRYYVHIGIGIVFFGLLVLRCAKMPLTKFTRFEAITAIILSIIVALIVIGVILFLILPIDGNEGIRFATKNLSTVSILFIVFSLIIPVLLIAISPFLRAKYLSVITMTAFCACVVATITYITIFYSNSHLMVIEYLIKEFLLVSVPLVFCLILYVNSFLLIKDKEKIDDVAGSQRIIGIFSLFLVVFTLFFTFSVAPLLRGYNFFTFLVEMFIPLAVAPCVMYFGAAKIVFVRYKREKEEEK